MLSTVLILIGSSCHQLQEDPPQAPNVVLLVIDALRPERLSDLGAARPTSPVLDSLAASGARFTRAYAQAPMTRMSMPSIFTSLYPSVHRVYSGISVLPNEFTTLAETMQSAGYRTACFTASPHGKSRYNFYQGYETYEGFEGAPTRRHDTAAHVVDKAIGWLYEQPAAPFLLYLHFMDVHTPWNAQGEQLDEVCADPGDDSSVDARICHYDRMIRYVDHHIGRLLEEINRCSEIGPVLLVVTSDHGEEFADHGSWGHGQSLYEELIRVPLILHLPGDIKPTTIDSIVRHIDLMPTIMRLVGIDPQSAIQGIDLMSAIRGDGPLELTTFSEGVRRAQPVRQNVQWEYLASVREDNWKLITTMPFDQITAAPMVTETTHETALFNLASDPLEKHNAINQHPERARHLLKILDEWQRSCSTLRSEYENQKGVKLQRRTDLDEKTRARLRAFGYIE